MIFSIVVLVETKIYAQKLISQIYALQNSDKPQCLYADFSNKFSRAEMSSFLLSFWLS